MEIEEDSRENARNDNTEGGREYFEDIVGVLDNHGNNKPPNSLYNHDRPHQRSVSAKEPLLGHSHGILGVNCDKSNSHRRKTHLDIA